MYSSSKLQEVGECTVPLRSRCLLWSSLCIQIAGISKLVRNGYRGAGNLTGLIQAFSIQYSLEKRGEI